MKLIKCKSCGDLVRLRRTQQQCSCQACSGRYLNGRQVRTAGPCVLLGVRSIDYFSGEDWKDRVFPITSQTDGCTS